MIRQQRDFRLFRLPSVRLLGDRRWSCAVLDLREFHALTRLSIWHTLLPLSRVRILPAGQTLPELMV